MKLRKKRCPCGSYFQPKNSFHVACCVEGSLKRVEQKKAQDAKRERKQTREQILNLKPLSYWYKRVEKQLHPWIRLRDEEQPCISCGTWDTPEWHAGHFIPVGRSSYLRFDPDNIHKQCQQCNIHKGGNQTQYEIRLTAKIGPEAVERLKTAPRSRDWTREELEALEKDYKVKLKNLLTASGPNSQ